MWISNRTVQNYTQQNLFEQYLKTFSDILQKNSHLKNVFDNFSNNIFLRKVQLIKKIIKRIFMSLTMDSELGYEY